MRSLLKRPLERALSASGVGRIMRGTLRGKRLILAYHGIIPSGLTAAGERALFVTQSLFGEHLDLLAEVADVAPLARIDEESDGRPRVAITIDDAYGGAVREGVRELAERSLPATIFVAPGRLGGQGFWWDVLASPTGVLDSVVRSHALDELAGSDERIRAWAAAKAMAAPTDLPAYAKVATLEELRLATEFPGITVGSHTWSHANLARLGTTEVVGEVTSSLHWLRGHFGGKAVDWLAYPYGRESVTARLAAADAGYAGAVCIDGGWHQPSRVSRYARPRLNIPAGLTVDGLCARLMSALIS